MADAHQPCRVRKPGDVTIRIQTQSARDSGNNLPVSGDRNRPVHAVESGRADPRRMRRWRSRRDGTDEWHRIVFVRMAFDPQPISAGRLTKQGPIAGVTVNLCISRSGDLGRRARRRLTDLVQVIEAMSAPSCSSADVRRCSRRQLRLPPSCFAHRIQNVRTPASSWLVQFAARWTPRQEDCRHRHPRVSWPHGCRQGPKCGRQSRWSLCSARRPAAASLGSSACNFTDSSLLRPRPSPACSVRRR